MTQRAWWMAMGLIAWSVGADAQVQSRAQQDCINRVNSRAVKLGQVQGKENIRCLKSASKAKLAISAEACLTADLGGRLAKATEKALADEAKRCLSTPAFAYTGVATGGPAAQSGRLLSFTDLFGDPLDDAVIPCATSTEGCGCQLAVAQRAEALAHVRWKEFVKCKKLALKAGAASAPDIAKCVSDAATAGSIAADSKQKISKAAAKLSEKIAKKCAGAGAAGAFAGGRCAASSGTALATCIDHHIACRVCQAIAVADGLSIDCDLADDGLPNDSCGASTECDDGNPCTADAPGAGGCTHTPASAGTVCRAAVGGCDEAETCDGSSTTCPADGPEGDPVCGGQCLTLVPDPPEAEIDDATRSVCADTCGAITNFIQPCGSCGECAVDEICVDGACQCRPGARVCQLQEPRPYACEGDERSTCEFLITDPPGVPPFHYTYIEVDAYEDTDLFFYLNFKSLYAPGTGHIPYVVTCDPDRGVFRIPGDTSQARHFEDGGRILSRSLLDAATTRDPRCADPDFRALPKSADIGAKGYYIKFTPNRGETGHHYNHIGFIIDPGLGEPTYEMVYVFVNVLPGPPPPEPLELAPSNCGDGATEGAEDCDCGADSVCSPSELEGSCTSRGFGGGTLACTLATCQHDTSACTPACGDGLVKPAYEQCDGGNLNGETCAALGLIDGTLTCRPDCTFDTSGCRGWERMFATATPYTGAFGGIANADGVCQSVAASASLPGSWSAWLSTATLDARHRIAGVEYRLVDDATVITQDGTELFIGPLLATPSKNEFGTLDIPARIRTGTNNDGTRAAQTCNDWFSGSAVDSSVAGAPFSSVEWSATTPAITCAAGAGLYCFEQPFFRRVFVTSATYDADLGGLAGADALCQSAADAAHLGRTWKAWLSTSTVAARDRIPDVEYRLVDGTTIVANDKADLLNGNLDASIDLDEFGTPQTGKVWTGTNNDGTTGPLRCSEWASDTGSGSYGLIEPVSVAMNWSVAPISSEPCGSAARVYCFEQ